MLEFYLTHYPEWLWTWVTLWALLVVDVACLIRISTTGRAEAIESASASMITWAWD